MKTYQLEIITPDRVIFAGAVSSVILPSARGQMGILANHAPLVAALEAGSMRVTEADGAVRVYAIGGGFVEVGKNEVRIAADVGESVDDIDEARARAVEERARKRLKERGGDFDLDRAEAALARAMARLRALREARAYAMGGARERAQAGAR